MKTVFKVGQKVYDQMFFPDVDGRIVDIHNENNKILLEVKFFSKYRLEPLCMQSSVFYTEKGNMINFLGGYNCGTSTLSTEPYKMILEGFEQKAPAPTFEEAWGETERVCEPKSEYDKEEFGGYPSQDLANAAEALRRLLFLRDYYNEGWQPDWKDGDEEKYCIRNFGNELCVMDLGFSVRVMAFRTPQIRDKFLEEQKKLLETAKPLL